MSSVIRIGTRSSPLARWQAEWVAGQLELHGTRAELIFITTQGDVTSGPLGQVGGQGLFTKEIQRALLDREVDLAVHSLKDLPTLPTPGLTLGAVPPRESEGDAFVSGRFASFAELPEGARVGTGSLRRKTQLLHARPDLNVLDIRGNVDTRLRKLDEGEYEAIVLAEAGLKRLGHADRIREVFPKEMLLPAVGQGALGLEIRVDDELTAAAVAPLQDPATYLSVVAERTMLAELRGGCLAPVGAWGRVEDGVLRLQGVVLSGDGRVRIAAESSTDQLTFDSATELGNQVAQGLKQQGADDLIATMRS